MRFLTNNKITSVVRPLKQKVVKPFFFHSISFLFLKKMSFAEEFNSSLADLKVNSKPLINMLTMLAEDYIENASTIVDLVENHLREVQDDAKLAVLYLIDSIVKNVGKDYKVLFSKNLVSIFCSVFVRGCEKTRAQMFKLRQTWNSVFVGSLMHELDQKVKKIDPNWPTVRILVNPKFFQGEEIIKQQKELLELEKRKLEILEAIEPNKRKDIDLLFGNEDTDLRKKMKFEVDEDKMIEIDNVAYQVRFYGETAIIIKNNDPKEISFQPGMGRIMINNVVKTLPFTAPYTELKVNTAEYLHIKFGAPTRELYINGKSFSATFNGPSINFGEHTIKLLSPMPKVQIGKSRTDLMAGKTNLNLDGQIHNLFLDFKYQKVEDLILKFGHSFKKVEIDGVWYDFEFEKGLKIKNRNLIFTNAIRFEKIDVGELLKKLVQVGIMPEIPKIDLLNPESLKIKNQIVIDSLYFNSQCSICGSRSDKLRDHLDWHFEENKKKPKNRNWYTKSFLEKPEETNEEPTVSVLGSETSCYVCADKFEQFFDQENEEWRFKNAIRKDGRIFHPICFEDYKDDILEIKEIKRKIEYCELSSDSDVSEIEFDLKKVKVEKVDTVAVKTTTDGDLEFETPKLIAKKIKVNIISVTKKDKPTRVENTSEEEEKITTAKSVKKSITGVKMKETEPVEIGKETSALCSLM